MKKRIITLLSVILALVCVICLSSCEPGAGGTDTKGENSNESLTKEDPDSELPTEGDSVTEAPTESSESLAEESGSNEPIEPETPEFDYKNKESIINFLNLYIESFGELAGQIGSVTPSQGDISELLNSISFSLSDFKCSDPSMALPEYIAMSEGTIYTGASGLVSVQKLFANGSVNIVPMGDGSYAVYLWDSSPFSVNLNGTVTAPDIDISGIVEALKLKSEDLVKDGEFVYSFSKLYLFRVAQALGIEVDPTDNVKFTLDFSKFESENLIVISASGDSPDDYFAVNIIYDPENGKIKLSFEIEETVFEVSMTATETSLNALLSIKEKTSTNEIRVEAVTDFTKAPVADDTSYDKLDGGHFSVYVNVEDGADTMRFDLTLKYANTASGGVKALLTGNLPVELFSSNEPIVSYSNASPKDSVDIRGEFHLGGTEGTAAPTVYMMLKLVYNNETVSISVTPETDKDGYRVKLVIPGEASMNEISFLVSIPSTVEVKLDDMQLKYIERAESYFAKKDICDINMAVYEELVRNHLMKEGEKALSYYAFDAETGMYYVFDVVVDPFDSDMVDIESHCAIDYENYIGFCAKINPDGTVESAHKVN